LSYSPTFSLNYYTKNGTERQYLKTLKHEEVYLCEYETFEDVMKRLPCFCDQYLA